MLNLLVKVIDFEDKSEFENQVLAAWNAKDRNEMLKIINEMNAYLENKSKPLTDDTDDDYKEKEKLAKKLSDEIDDICLDVSREHRRLEDWYVALANGMRARRCDSLDDEKWSGVCDILSPYFNLRYKIDYSDNNIELIELNELNELQSELISFEASLPLIKAKLRELEDIFSRQGGDEEKMSNDSDD
jgi:hypothetical protein